MLAAIALFLLILWVLGFATAHVFGGVIHILLLVAVIALIAHFLRGRSGTAPPF